MMEPEKRLEEIKERIRKLKFSKEIRCYGDDYFIDLMTEIFYDGMREGYELAKFRLELLNRFPSGSAKEYLAQNASNIRESLRFIDEIEKIEKGEKNE